MQIDEECYIALSRVIQFSGRLAVVQEFTVCTNTSLMVVLVVVVGTDV